MTEAEQDSSPIITPKVLEALEGGELWAVELTDAVEAISNHSFLAGRTADYLGKALKEKGVPGYKNVDLGLVVQGALLHDSMKLPSRHLVDLTPEQKSVLGLSEDPYKTSNGADELATKWLKQLGFPPQVYEGIRAHDFPQAITDNPYWKIIVLSDAMAGPRITTVNERVTDLHKRWIKDPTEKGLKPVVEEEQFRVAENNFHTVANEIFEALGTTDEKFIEDNKLDDDSSMPKWERFLRRQRGLKRERRTTEVMVKLASLSR